MAPSIDVLIPSLNRAHLLERLLGNLRANTCAEITVTFAVSDPESANLLFDLGEDFVMDGGASWPVRINHLFQVTSAPYVFLGSDDLLFTSGWDHHALKAMAKVDGVVAVNDLHNPSGTSALVSRAYVDEHGGEVVCPDYHHNYADTELFDRAKRRGRFTYCASSIVEHLHHHAGKSPHDDTYAISERWEEDDHRLYLTRSAQL